MTARPILIMAGGTGGHIFPALAVAERLRERGVPLLWLGTRRGLEATLVPQAGYRLVTVGIGGLRGKGWSTRLGAPFRITAALAQSLFALLRIRPACVLGMGGFVSGPGGIAAWLLRVPLLIHEQNAIAGVTNKLLARVATGVMEAFPGTFARRFRAIQTGNPVRGAIAGLPPPAIRFDSLEGGGLRLLILGGSQGASALNRALPGALSRLASKPIEVWHQSGAKEYEPTRKRYAALGLEARVEDFIQDMAAAYAWTHLVVCRAGAITVAELAAAGVGSILVPYPHAVDDHQTLNARYLSERGAAILLPEAELEEGRLASLLSEIRGAPERLRAMAECARNCAFAEATTRVAELCLEAARG